MPDLGLNGAALSDALIKVTPQHQHWLDPALWTNVGSLSDPRSSTCSPDQSQVMYQSQGSTHR